MYYPPEALGYCYRNLFLIYHPKFDMSSSLHKHQRNKKHDALITRLKRNSDIRVLIGRDNMAQSQLVRLTIFLLFSLVVTGKHALFYYCCIET